MNGLATRSSSGMASATRSQQTFESQGPFEDAQELLRHANSRVTQKVYTRAISSMMPEANGQAMQMFLNAGGRRFQHPRQHSFLGCYFLMPQLSISRV